MAVASRPFTQVAFEEQIDRHQGWNDCAADIDRNQRALPMANGRHSVPHAEEIHVMVGHRTFRRQFRDRDVEKTADQRGK
jgi:hypothetical protein